MAKMVGPGSELTITNLILDIRNILDGISGYPEKHLANLDNDSYEVLFCSGIFRFVGKIY